MSLNKITKQMVKECKSAISKFPKFASYHEGYAVLKEEVDELWDEIKGIQNKDRLREEATQIGAMAIRFINDLLEVENE